MNKFVFYALFVLGVTEDDEQNMTRAYPEEFHAQF
jgi:hypothetical protein